VPSSTGSPTLACLSRVCPPHGPHRRKMTLRIVFFGDSQSVFSSRHFGALQEAPCRLVGVVDAPPRQRLSTNPLPPGLPNFGDAARATGIPVFEPARTDDPEFVAAVRALAPDLFVAAGYGLILKPKLLEVPRLVAANFHASLLPHYRGRHPVFWTLRAGERWAGLTVHAIDAGIDTGDILYQVKVRTRRDDTVAALYERIMDRSVGLVPRLLHDAGRGAMPRRPQAAGEGSYFSRTTEEDFRIHWSWPAERIRRHITVTPGKCFADTPAGRVYLVDARLATRQKEAAPGVVVALGRQRATVAAGEGAVSLGSLRLADGAQMPMAKLCRRWRIAVGATLVVARGEGEMGEV
jgi:methionyl-tRNA formyltransferase